MMIRLLAVSGMLAITFVATGKAQGWRGIVPLHASCEDVKRILNVAKCEPNTIELDEAKVFISFSDGTCRSEWNVPVGTVLSLDVTPKRMLKLSDLNVALNEYSKEVDRQVPFTSTFTNQREGISIAAFEDGRIRHIFYGPSSKDEHMRCGPVRADGSNAAGHGSVKFDEYDLKNLKEASPRLDQFATTLAGWVGARGYIIVYPGGSITLKKAELHAVQAKRYLVKNRRIDSDRIVTLIGGLREDPSVELYITVKNGDPPIPSPQAPRY